MFIPKPLKAVQQSIVLSLWTSWLQVTIPTLLVPVPLSVPARAALLTDVTISVPVFPATTPLIRDSRAGTLLLVHRRLARQFVVRSLPITPPLLLT